MKLFCLFEQLNSSKSTHTHKQRNWVYVDFFFRIKPLTGFETLTASLFYTSEPFAQQSADGLSKRSQRVARHEDIKYIGFPYRLDYHYQQKNIGYLWTACCKYQLNKLSYDPFSWRSLTRLLTSNIFLGIK